MRQPVGVFVMSIDFGAAFLIPQGFAALALLKRLSQSLKCLLVVDFSSFSLFPFASLWLWNATMRGGCRKRTLKTSYRQAFKPRRF